MNMWEKNAEMVEKIYGGFVDWEERFYNCPECGEPIYEYDWPGEDLNYFICPVCDFYGDDKTDDCNYETGFDPYMGCFTDDC